jgi:glycosyltransferase involved in cell wall biosynthesis
MPLVLINNSQETFTPTQSGAIATWVWEVCQAAERGGERPWVVTRRSEAAMYEWPETVAVDYPREATTAVEKVIGRAGRKVFGHTEVGMETYGRRVIRVLRERKLAEYPLVLQNDLELAVMLRRAFPRATIIHHFHNQLGCKPRFGRHVAESCDAITAVSRYTGLWAEREFGLAKGAVKTVYNGVDSGRFFPVGEGGEEAGGRPPMINFHGKTTHHKAPDLLLSAGMILADRKAEFSIQLVGSNFWHKFEVDDYQQKLQSQIERLAARKIAVRRTGHLGRAAIPDALRRCQIHCVPSRWDEPFGLVTLEGMASGLATVGSNTGATPEVLGEAGLLFERESAESLADQLWKLLSDVPLRKRLAREGRKRAELFTWDATWEALSGVLSNVGRVQTNGGTSELVHAKPMGSVS